MAKQTLNPAVPAGEVVLVEPKLHWLIGAIVLSFGVVWSAIGFLLNAAIPKVGMLFAFLSALCFLWRNGVLVNYGTRTYRAPRGFLPFVKTLSGPFTDFDHIRLARESRDDGDGTSMFWCVCLLWKENRRRTDDIVVTRDASRASAEAYRLAAALGLRLDDRSAELAPSEQKAWYRR